MEQELQDWVRVAPPKEPKK
jgi:hypothetical protein